MQYEYSDPAVAAFIIIPVCLVAALLWGTAAAWRRSGAPRAVGTRAALRAAATAILWMFITWQIADRGTLRDWDRMPPPFAFLVLAILSASVALAFGRTGARLAAFLPLWILVAVQSFRLPLELAMHAMYERGIMPVQMSYSGRNFDIVTGTTAIVVAGLVATGLGGRKLVAAWNVLGLGLLVNVVIVAILSLPTFRYFGNDRLNVWVTYPPFVWLPTVMVVAALAGHLIIFRALARQLRGTQA